MKLARYFQKLFGTVDLADGRVAKFGSLAGGSPAFAANPADVQSQPQFTDGWVEAVMGLNYPAIEDENALDYLWGYQLAYLFQAGVAEWDSATFYFQGSIVNVGGILYTCTNDNSGAGQQGNSVDNPTFWSPALQSGTNSALNGAFDFWQWGTSNAVPHTAAPQYVADRWAIVNRMDAGTAVVQIDQIAGSNIGSIYALKSHITTAPTAPVPVGFETIQVLDVAESSKFSDSNVTFTVLVKGVGHVNNINLSVFTALPGTLASPQVLGTRNPVLAVAIPVTTLGFTLCKITCTMPSLAGGIVLGVSIAPSGASTGNTSDVGNGLILEQAMLSYAPSFFNRAYNDAGVELSACQRFYESTYEDGIAPGTITDSGQMEFYATGTNNVLSVQFKTRKRILGGTLIFSPNTGTSGKIFDITTAADKTAGASLGGYTGGFVMTTTGETSGDLCSLHWASDAEIY